MDTPKKRLLLPDVLKGLAVVLMIHAHVMEQLVNPIMFEGTLGKIAMHIGVFPGAAVFMLVMGYFAAKSSARPGRIIKRGLIIFVGGLLLNIALNISYVIRFIQTGYPELIPTAIFGVDILLLAGLSLIIVALTKTLASRAFIWLALALIVTVITPLINNIIDGWESGKYLTAFIGGTAKWSYFPLFPWLAYPLAGAGAYYIGFKWWPGLETGYKWLIGSGLIAGAAIGYPFAFKTATNLSAHYHHGTFYFLWSLSFVLLLVIILNRLRIEKYPLRSAFLSFTGREVTLIYVIQWILIGNIAAWYGSKTLFVGHIAWTLGIILLSVLLAYLYRQIRLRTGNQDKK